MTKRKMIDKLIDVMRHNPCINVDKQRRYYNSLSKVVIQQEYDYYIEHKYESKDY